MAAGIAKGVLVRIESLMLFLRVVESGSISRAARESFISQQGASAAIKGLEQDFGIELFDRASSRLQLTARGRRFAREAEQVVAAYRRMQAVAALDSDVGPSESLRIVTTPHALHVLAPVFDAYRHINDGEIPLLFTEESLFDIVETFPGLMPDVVYVINLPTFMRDIIGRIGASFEPVVVSELMLCCSADSPLADRKRIDAHELAGVPIVCYNEALLIRLVSHVLKDIEGADIYVQTSNLELLGEMMERQHMVSFTDSLSVQLNGLTGGQCVVPIDGSVRFTTGILGSAESEQARRFASFFKRFFRTTCANYLDRYPIEPQ